MVTARYAGKRFSVLGDSISTLEGFQPPHYEVFYTPDWAARAGIGGMEDTWWGRVIAVLHGMLGVNDAYSGSLVSRLAEQPDAFPSACSRERVARLRENGMPDVIIIYAGTNDCGYDVPLHRRPLTHWSRSFDSAYRGVLRQVRRRYPRAEIWCMTPAVSDNQSRRAVPLSERKRQVSEIIAQLARRYHARLIPLEPLAHGYTTVDGLHADKNGMMTIAAAVLHTLEQDEK